MACGVFFRVTAIIIIIMVFTYLLFLMAYSMSNVDESSAGSIKYGNHFEVGLMHNPQQLNISKQQKNQLDEDNFYWPTRSIPYQMTTEHTQEQQEQIKKALTAIETVSCLKFKSRINESDYIQLSAKEIGCFSAVGYLGGAQVLNLQQSKSGKCFIFGAIIHQFLHALGIKNTHTHNTQDLKNGSHTVKPLNKSIVNLIGEREKLSEMDIAMINKAYCH
ncbi:astacin-like metalloprotease toxin 5 [Contarinia nasturtii]|uniref:astacin-like metalloprotease toxin 5 n=1 Tax=Contarinia nasturtii TaxID=265458 RepID=UPI0012D3C83D|nr:astacin-like metalloprotease toxin 5 [Contarinia nasturtii]